MMHDFVLPSSMKHHRRHHHQYCYHLYHRLYDFFCFCEELTVGTGPVYVKCV
jgi:hypothetical protein